MVKPCLLRTYPEIVNLYSEDFFGQCIDQVPSLECIFSLSGPLNHRKFPPFPSAPCQIFSCFKKLNFLSFFLFQLPIPCLPSHHQHPSLLLQGWGAARPLPQSIVGLVLILIDKNILSHMYCFFFPNWKSNMFILDHLENTGKRNEENNYQGSQYPFFFKSIIFFPFLQSRLLHLSFYVFECLGIGAESWRSRAVTGGPWLSLKLCRMQEGIARRRTFGSSPSKESGFWEGGTSRSSGCARPCRSFPS